MTAAHPIPTAALDDRLAFVGTAGSGKTYAATGAVERLLAAGARVILVDPLDVAWGLRLMADGKTASRFDVVMFGGAHGDLPITEGSGALIGEAVATMAESCIISLGAFTAKAAERRFMLAFLTALYRHAAGEPVHLVIDEADMFAPQRLMDKEGEAAKLLGQMETIVRRGRVKGFIPWLITQRPAVLSKDVLSQADGLIALKLTASQDRDAIGAWIEGQADRAEGKAVLAALPAMQRGAGYVWIPGRGILEAATFPAKTTFDSSRTPRRGETVRHATLKPLVLGGLKQALAALDVEAKANDPRALKAEIARLRAGKVPAPFDPALIEQAEARARRAGMDEGFKLGAVSGQQHMYGRALDAIGALRAELEDIAPPPVPKPAKVDLKVNIDVDAPPVIPPADTNPSGALGLARAAAKVHPTRLTWSQVATLAGRKPRGGHFNTSRKVALANGWLEAIDGHVVATPAGIEASGAEPFTGELADVWAGALPQPAAKMFAMLRAMGPMSVERLAGGLGMQPRGGHWNTGLATLKRNGLVVDRGGRLRLAELGGAA